MNRKKILLTVCAMAVILPIIAGCDQGVQETPRVQHQEQLRVDVEPCLESAGCDQGEEEMHSVQHQEQLQVHGEPCLESAGCNQGAEETPRIQQREYLQGTVPPCTESAGWEADPCDIHPIDHSSDESNASSGPLSYLPETTYDTLRGITPALNETIHLLFRGIMLPGTTRCDFVAPLVGPYYAPKVDEGTHIFTCHADFTVHDYIVGDGPSIMTVGVDGTIFSLRNFGDDLPSDSWLTKKTEEMKKSIASKYSGREVILGIAPSLSTSSEAWHIVWRWYA